MRTARGQGGDIPRNRQHPLFRLTVMALSIAADDRIHCRLRKRRSAVLRRRADIRRLLQPRQPAADSQTSEHRQGDDRRLAGRTHRQPNAPGKQPAGIKNLREREKSITFAPQKAGSVLTLRPGFPALLKRICLAYSSGPDGGIGRRVGLKHRWSNPCRFDPGSGY